MRMGDEKRKINPFFRIMKKIFVLKPLPTVLIALPSFLLVIYVLANVREQSLICYIAYLMSAYSLIIVITGFGGIVRAVRSGIRALPLVKKLYSIPIGERYMEDAMFRTQVALYQGLFINTVYAVIKLLSGVIYHSVWMVALAVYYIFLILLRASLAEYVRHYRIGTDIRREFRRYRSCGVILLLMNLALIAIVGLIVYRNAYFYYPGYLIYLIAFYCFYSIITAIVNVVRSRKHGSPVMSAAKVITLTTAAVSMLSLTTAMLATFGNQDEGFRKLMTSLVGGGVCMTVFGMALFMILRANRSIRQDSI